MSYALMYSECAGCHKVMGYNPHLVPSIRINGTREPVCKECIDLANPNRIKNGLEPVTIRPGAYEPEEVPY